MDEKLKVTNKCPICGRPTHKESKYCIFHASAEGKTEDEFKNALKEYIREIKEEDKDYDFEKFIFIGDMIFEEDLKINIFKNTNFKRATFEGEANFNKINFKGDTNFGEVTFKGDTTFYKVIFYGSTYFYKINFKGYTTFREANFVENADFREVTFKGDVDFEKVTFKGYADFEKATFKGGTEFEEVTFKGNVDFDGATFGKYADFLGTTFEGDANFKVKSFIKYVIFKKIRVSPGKKLYLKVTNDGVNVYFERAYLENVYLDIDLVEGILIDFTGALLKNTKIKKGQIENHILQEKEKELSKAKEIFLLLKNNFHSIGQYEDESWAFDSKRKKKWIDYHIHFPTIRKF